MQTTGIMFCMTSSALSINDIYDLTALAFNKTDMPYGYAGLCSYNWYFAICKQSCLNSQITIGAFLHNKILNKLLSIYIYKVKNISFYIN